MPPNRNSWNEISAMISSVEEMERGEQRGKKRGDSNDVTGVRVRVQQREAEMRKGETAGTERSSHTRRWILSPDTLSRSLILTQAFVILSNNTFVFTIWTDLRGI